MIYRQLKFEVVYDVGEVGRPIWKREPVAEMLCAPEFGVTSVKTISDVELALDPLKVSLLQSIGMYDKEGSEIFHAHVLVEDEKTAFQVVFANGCFYLNRAEELIVATDEVCRKLKIVGDIFGEYDLVDPQDAEKKVLESKERKILPPLVNLKKKSN